MKYRLFGVGLKGKSPVISSQHRINCYIERVVDEDTEQSSICASPGMVEFADFGDTPHRGAYELDDLMYTVHRDKFYEVNNAGIRTERGTLSTSTGRVDIFSDDGDTIMVLDGTAGYLYTVSTASFTTIASANFPDAAQTGTWQDGYYFAFGPDDFFRLSEDGSTWNALDLASAEVGNIVRGIGDHGELVIFGKKRVAFWGNTGASDFPYAPIRSATREVGLAARWSVAKFDDSLAFLGKNTMGQVQVYRLSGHTPQVISTPELESIINRYAGVADATAYAHLFEGHPFYRLNFPSAGKSWEYDGLSKVWCERQSGTTGGRHRGEMCIDFVNKTCVFDYENGKVYRIDHSTYTENGEQYPFEITSRRLVKDFDPFTVNRLFLDFETGTGLATGQGENPQVMLEISRDGGRVFQSERWKTLGQVGKYLTRVEWDQFGTADSFVIKVRITDPVKRHLMNAALIE